MLWGPGWVCMDWDMAGGTLEKPSGYADLIQPGLVLLLCSAPTFPSLQPFPRMWGWRWAHGMDTLPSSHPSQGCGDGDVSSWDGYVSSTPALAKNVGMEIMDVMLMGWTPPLHPSLF